MGERRKRTITMADFQSLRPHLSKRWADENIEIARRLLVDNEKPSAIAKITGKSPQQLARIANGLWKAYEDHMQATMIPADWVEVTVFLPPEVAVLVKTLGDNAMKALKEQLDRYMSEVSDTEN